jgi:hypothetical protein
MGDLRSPRREVLPDLNRSYSALGAVWRRDY